LSLYLEGEMPFLNFKSDTGICLDRFIHRSSTGDMEVMNRSNFQQKDDLWGIILQIIAEYQPITTMDIWYELGEDDGFKNVFTRTEFNETLSQLKKQKMIIRGDDDQWKITNV